MATYALLVISLETRSHVEAMGVRFLPSQSKYRPPEEGEVHPDDWERYEDWVMERGERLAARTSGAFAEGAEDAKNFFAVPVAHRAALEAVFPEFAGEIREIPERGLEDWSWDYDWRRDLNPEGPKA